MLLSYY